ncbi:MAG: DUF3450 domain-containing protein [Pseudomonadota bacterium]
MRIKFLLLAALTLPLLAVAQAPDKLDQALKTTIDSNRASAASQQRIDGIDDSARSLLERYRAATWQAQQLSVYAKQLEQLLGAQEAEKVSLRQQLVEIDRTERELTPLMLRMLDSLDKFVTLDLPFLKQERRERVENLKRLMADPEATSAERYRRLLEAYQVEIDYGRSLGTERAQIGDDGTAREVDVLRIGRASLFYLTLDGEEAGRWDGPGKKWEPVENEWRASIKKGLRIAREISAPDVLHLPMPVVAGGGK